MRNLLRVLVIGFTAVIALLAAAAIIEVNNARSIAASAAELVNNQLLTARLLDEVEREQGVLNTTLYRLSNTPDAVNRDRVLADLDQTEGEIHRMVAEARSGPNEAAWNNLERAVLDFSQATREVLAQKKVTSASSRDLFFRHEAVTVVVARLVDLTYARAVETRRNMDQQSEKLAEESAILIGASFIVALVAAVVTVRIAARVFRQMESQTGELSRVSFRLMEVQESTARRFSHELHDELGGSLTAIKTNLAAIAARHPDREDRARIDDAVKLVDGAISNVRELSQLLRPTILDDFGLDAGIRWLTDRFRDRARIEVEYKSEFTGRLQDETETHLFRIVQEALTNIARHSGATRVSIHLRKEKDEIRLTIQDNGKGISEARGGGMGLNGMRARARSAGGELKMKTTPGGGLTIEVSAPLGKLAEERA
ncbi:MAG: sensor histidine kinase [Acidobacteriia bacterium]|nr:sensor histidine kinase [Terriglobia bacterium]